MGGDREWTGANMTIEDVVMMPKGVVVGREIVSASFEEWITHVFDRQPGPNHWRWSDDFVEWAVPASDTVNFLAMTFEESGTLLTRFTDDQIAEGLWYLSSSSLSEIALTLWDEAVPWVSRQRALRSIKKLYADCFDVRCVPFLSHLERNSTKCSNPINGACYMWWDIFPNMRWLEKPSGNEVEKECIAAMEFAL